MKREFTATVYIVSDSGDQVLLIYHKKLQKWLPPGGHIDPNETPPEAAIREAKEETGLTIQLIDQENIYINEKNATSFLRPYMCLLEKIPAFQNTPTHEHMDMIYIGKVVGGTLNHNKKETEGMKWFGLEELKELKPDIELFKETYQTLSLILSNRCFTHADEKTEALF